MKVRAKEDAIAGAGLNIDMRKDAALADQSKIGEAVKQRARDAGPLADQHKSFDVGKPVDEFILVFNMIRPDGYIMPRQLCEARKRPQRIKPVVKNRNLHACPHYPTA